MIRRFITTTDVVVIIQQTETKQDKSKLFTVADPGFPTGGGANPGRGRQHTI